MADHGGGKGARKVVWDSFWASRGWKPQISAREPANPARRPVNCPAAAESACLPNAKLQLARQVQSQSSAKNRTSGGVHGQMASRKRSSNSHSRPDTFWWCMARVGLGDPVEGLECKALAHSSDNMIPWARKGFLSANQPERLRE